MPAPTSSARRVALALLCALQLLVPSAVLAQSAPEPMMLDLHSTTPSEVVADLTSPVAIRVGNSIMNVSSTTQLTPAQYAAVSQVMSTGQQSLNLGAAGNAVS